MYHLFHIEQNKFSEGMTRFRTADDIEVCLLHCMNCKIGIVCSLIVGVSERVLQKMISLGNQCVSPSMIRTIPTQSRYIAMAMMGQLTKDEKKSAPSHETLTLQSFQRV